MVHGTWYMVLGPWSLVLGTRYMVCGLKPDTRSPTPEARNPKPETRSPKPEARNPKPETRSLTPETRSPTPEARNPKPETRSLTPETLYPLPSTRYQVPFDLQDWSKDDTFAVPKRVTRSHAPRTPGLGVFLSRKIQSKNRDVAQPGSALAWGARGREFESRHPDQKSPTLSVGLFFMQKVQLSLSEHE